MAEPKVEGYADDGTPIFGAADLPDVSPVLTGRHVIYTDAETVDAENVVQVLNEVLPTFYRNQSEINYLYGYYKGKQPILNRVKEVRPEINNKIVENHAWEIVSFKVAYLLGAPIAYTRRKIRSGEARMTMTPDEITAAQTRDPVSEKVGRLNEIMHVLDKEAIDHDIAEWNHICGTAFRYVIGSLENDEKIEIGSLDPRRTGVVYSKELGAKPVMAFQETLRDKQQTIYTVWTDTMQFEIVNNTVTSSRLHGIGAVPIIEYPLNNARLGSFEVVLEVLDGINKLSSNRLDGTEQFVQSFIKFVNCQIDPEKYKEFRQEGAIVIKSDNSNPSDVDIISSELDQSQTQVEIDHLYQQALTICGMPDRNGANRTTGDTGNAVLLRDGWAMAESCARDTVMQWERSEKQFLRIALSLLRTYGKLDLGLADIDIRFTKGNTENLLVKTQALMNLLDAGVHPEIAFGIPHLFDDPNQAYIDSIPYLAARLQLLESTARDKSGQHKPGGGSNDGNKESSGGGSSGTD